MLQKSSSLFYIHTKYRVIILERQKLRLFENVKIGKNHALLKTVDDGHKYVNLQKPQDFSFIPARNGKMRPFAKFEGLTSRNLYCAHCFTFARTELTQLYVDCT